MSQQPAPLPNYGAAGESEHTPGSFPQPGVASTYQAPTEPPPKYQPQPAQEYDQTNQYTGYQAANPYPVAGAVHQTIIVGQPRLGPHPATLNCPYCQAVITTNVDHQAGLLTWLSAGLICIFGCWMGCCLIPFCIDELQDVQHGCPNCGRTLGRFERL